MDILLIRIVLNIINYANDHAYQVNHEINIRTEEKEHEEKSWLYFYEYAPVFWSSGHGGRRSREKAGFYTENHYR